MQPGPDPHLDQHDDQLGLPQAKATRYQGSIGVKSLYTNKFLTNSINTISSPNYLCILRAVIKGRNL